MKKFEKPSMEKVEFESNDVITTSGCFGDHNYCQDCKDVCGRDDDKTPGCDYGYYCLNK